MKKLEVKKDGMQAHEKKALLDTIKSLQKAIEVTRSQLPPVNVVKSKVQVSLSRLILLIDARLNKILFRNLRKKKKEKFKTIRL